MKLQTISVTGIEGAVIGIRLPMCKNLEEAYQKSDSNEENIGADDILLCKKLIKADENNSGQPNSKFLRMIHVQVSITAPLYYYKELDTYKIATVSNSTSTMHKLADTPITKECFEMDDFEEKLDLFYKGGREVLDRYWNNLIEHLEGLRNFYNKVMENKKYLEEIKEFDEAKKAQVMAKKYWKELIRLLPESWLQTRMFDCDYATLRNIYRQRKNHKLSEWHTFCDWVKTLPYANDLICED